MKTYDVCLQLSCGQLHLTVKADSPEEAEDKAWDQAVNDLNGYKLGSINES